MKKFILLMMAVLFISGCAGLTDPKNQQESLAIFYMMSEDFKASNGMMGGFFVDKDAKRSVQVVALPTKLRKKSSIMIAIVPNDGNYFIDSVWARTAAGDVFQYVFPYKTSDMGQFKVSGQGVYFVGTYHLHIKGGLFKKADISIGEEKSPTEKEVLTELLANKAFLKEGKWRTMIEQRLAQLK